MRVKLYPSQFERGETRRELLIAGLIIVIIFAGVYIVSRFIIPALKGTATPLATPSLTASPTATVTPLASNATALPTRPPVGEPCVPGFGACADGKLCPEKGVCCPANNSNCDPPVVVPRPHYCAPKSKCPNGRECPATGVCFVDQPSPQPCVPGSICGDGNTCSSAGFCPGVQSKLIPCIPYGSTCPNGSQCPRTGICPF